MAILLALLAVIAVFAFLVKGRTGHPGLSELNKYVYAHRGLHSPGVPENSMAAFRRAKDAGYGAELDVHLMADGNLAVIHDSSLKRTAGAEITVEELTTADLYKYSLEGTKEQIPLLSQVLELYHGTAPLIVELKPTKDNYTALCKAACDLLESYSGAYCLESFDPRCIAWLRKHRKSVIRGQLTQNYFRTGGPLPGVMKFALRHQLLNVFTRPDFVAYCFADRKTVSNFLCRKLWGVQGVTWTLRTQEDFDTACREGWLPIFENFKP